MSTRAQKKLESRQALMDAVITLTAHGRSFDSLSLRQVTAEAGLVQAGVIAGARGGVEHRVS